MSQTIESNNKALVLKAFDTLFNKRDYVAAERSRIQVVSATSDCLKKTSFGVR